MANLPLTAEQFAAATHNKGPCIVCSVAGSGKTHTVCELCRFWVAIHGVPASRILVATFSTKAANDFKRRAARAGLPRSIEMRTLNSVGWSMEGELSRKRDPLLVSPRSPLGWYVTKIVREALKAWRARTPKAQHNLLPKQQVIFGEIGNAKAHLIWPDAWTAKNGDEFPAYVEWARTRGREPLEVDLTAEVIADVYAKWEAVAANPESAGYDVPDKYQLPRPLRGDERRSKIGKVRWFSFEDQLAYPARWILEGRSFMEAYRGYFDRVVVDEAQDNNLAQNIVASHLAWTENGPNLVMVGDDQQSIYAFRGAQPSLLSEFISKHGARVLQMSANFRSADIILRGGQVILDMAEDRLFEGDLVLGRTDDKAHEGVLALDVYNDDKDEAASIVTDMASLIESGTSPDDIAVLMRANSQSAPFEVELIKRGVRYQVAGTSFFERSEVRAVVAYLQAARDETDVHAFQRAAKSPNRYLGRKFFDAFATLADAREAYGNTTKRRALNAGWRRGLSELLPHIDHVRGLLDAQRLVAAIWYVANDVGVKKFSRDEKASEDDETESDLNITALAECATAVADVEVFMSYAADYDAERSNHNGERTKEPRVMLSTIHAAKGLEWDVCFLPGWRHGTLPHARGIFAEEMRLAYVAITRAAQQAFVSYSRVNPFGDRARPSVFFSKLTAVPGVRKGLGLDHQGVA